MSTEDNKTIVRRGIEEHNGGNLAVIDELYSPDFVNHDPFNPTVRSRQDFKQWFTGLYAAFPDIHFTLDDILAEGDKAAYRITLRATQSGSWRGGAPTGKSINITGTEIVRIRDGKFAERWVNSDALGLLQQLGAIPKPG
jgi:predicted ester cyclase